MRLVQGAGRARARGAGLRASRVWHPDDGRVDVRGLELAAVPRDWRQRASNADRRRRRPVERRCRPARHEGWCRRRDRGAEAARHLWVARGGGDEAAGPREGIAEGEQRRLQPDRQADAAHRCAREGRRPRAVRDRQAAARHEDGGDRASPGAGRARPDVRPDCRAGGQGCRCRVAGSAGSRRQRGGGHRRRLLARPAGARGAAGRLGASRRCRQRRTAGAVPPARCQFRAAGAQ